MPNSGREFLLDFVDMYRELPCLWEKASPGYHNKNKRNAALDRLVALFKRKDPHANRETVQKKLSSLRGSFNKEMRKVKASETSDKVHVPKLWYFEHLLFLQDQHIPRRSFESCPILACKPYEGDESENNEELNTTSHQSEETERTSLSFKQLCPKSDIVLDKISSCIDQPSSQQKVRNVHNVFGEYVGKKMESLPASMVSFCQKIINDAIFFAENEKLNFSSRIMTDLPTQRN